MLSSLGIPAEVQVLAGAYLIIGALVGVRRIKELFIA
jgi:hypothetical protein